MPLELSRKSCDAKISRRCISSPSDADSSRSNIPVSECWTRGKEPRLLAAERNAKLVCNHLTY